MKSYIEKYLLERTNELSFISIKENAELNLSGYSVLKGGLDIPLCNADIARQVKDKTAQSGISAASIARGIIEVMGIDPTFKNIEEYKKMLFAIDPDIKKYIEYSGVKLANEGSKIGAAVYFRALLQLDESSINALFNYALLCRDIANEFAGKESQKERDFLKESRQYFERLTHEHPEFSKGFYYLAFFKYEDGEFEAARKMWERACELGLEEELDQDVTQMVELCREKVRIQEGIELVIEGDPKEALEVLLPLANRHGGDWKLLFFIGVAYRQIGYAQEAMMYFRDIMLMDGNNVDAIVEMGLCKAMLGELESSIEYFEKAIELRSDDPEILCNLAMAHFNKGAIEKAQQLIQMSIQIDPDDEITKACLLEIQKNLN